MRPYSIIFFLFLSAISCAGSGHAINGSEAVNGVMDLSNASPDSFKPVNLDGEWEFYQSKLLTPAEKISVDKSSGSRIIRVPGVWNDFTGDGKNIGGSGYATYRLIVKLNPLIRSPLAMEFLEIGTAYKVFVNGEYIGGKGNVAFEKKNALPSTNPDLYVFVPQSSELEILIHVSNYNYRIGGIWQSVTLGDAGLLIKENKIHLLAEALFIGCLIIMGLYHLLVFAVARNEKAPLIFGFICLDIALRQMVTGHKYLLKIFQSIPFGAYVGIEYITFIIAVPLFALYLRSLFNERFSAVYLRVLWIIFVSYAALIVLTDAAVYTEIVNLYYLNIIIFMIYSVYITFRAYFEGHRDPKYIIFPGLILTAAAVNDILYQKMIIFTANLLPAAMVLFIFSQAFLLARRYARAFELSGSLAKELAERNQNLTDVNRELIQLKDSLSDKIQERTHDLEIAKDRAEAANRSKNTFLANVSHELRTPLNAILGFSQLLQMKNLNLEPNDLESINYIRREGDHLLAIVNDLLDVSRIEAGKISIEKKPVDIASLTLDVYEVMKTSAAEKGLTFTSSIDENSGIVIGDKTRLREILINLISNAIKFTPAGGEIIISVKKENDSVLLNVKDNGIGIPYQDLWRIFKPFEQVVTRESGKPAGAGLGLAISKILAELHGGKIFLDSTEGNGASFTVTLPSAGAMADDKTNADVSVINPAQAEKISGEILIVEDSEPIIKLYKMIIPGTGLKAEFAENASQAVPAAVNGNFNLILMDINLPGKDGVSILREIRSALGAKTPPAIAVTAHAMEGDRERFIADGFSDYISKPFDVKELVEKINSNLLSQKGDESPADFQK